MIKKSLRLITVALLCFSVLLIVASCNKDVKQKTETTTDIETDEILPSNTYLENESQKNNADIDSGGGDLILHKYRQNYYTIPAPFSDIVDSEEFEKWYGDILQLNPNDTNKMIIKEFFNFFKHFSF